MEEVSEDWKRANVTLVFSLPFKGQGGPRILQDSQPYLGPWEYEEETNPGNNICVYEGQEGGWKYSAWICEE